RADSYRQNQRAATTMTIKPTATAAVIHSIASAGAPSMPETYFMPSEGAPYPLDRCGLPSQLIKVQPHVAMVGGRCFCPRTACFACIPPRRFARRGGCFAAPHCAGLMLQFDGSRRIDRAAAAMSCQVLAASLSP